MNKIDRAVAYTVSLYPMDLEIIERIAKAERIYGLSAVMRLLLRTHPEASKVISVNGAPIEPQPCENAQ